MNGRRQKLVQIIPVALFAAGLALADDVRVLSWDDLLPPVEEQQKLMTPDDFERSRADNLSDWGGEESFEHMFATPVYPTGVVESLDGVNAKLPGFIVPLELSDEGKVREFLLVPYFGACIHMPAPPPNQIVYATASEPFELESMWDPVWLTGVLKTESNQTYLASAGYSMAATGIEEYEY